MSAIVSMQGISKVYRTEDIETHALSDIDLTIEKGEFLSIAGPSGCGKSTLLAIIGLLDSATAGSYELSGKPVASLDAAARAAIRSRYVGFIFQSFNLIPQLSVFANVELPLTYRTDIPRRERAERVEAALEKVDMAHRRRHTPTQLSGGQQQRVAIARALVGDPEVLLADEPTGNLDSRNGQAVMDLLAGLHDQGATLCMVTHDPRFAEYADRTVNIFDGAIVNEHRRPRRADSAAA
ncbi:MAG: ABC transporter ATP-binding protein [Pseudomonadota bacterium]